MSEKFDALRVIKNDANDAYTGRLMVDNDWAVHSSFDSEKAYSLFAELIHEGKIMEESIHMLGMTCGRFSEVLARIRGDK